MTAMGVYEGNDPATVEAFESWFGGAPDFIRGNGGRANWVDYVESLSWLGKQFSGLDVPIYWTVPMFANGSTLAKGATGSYDSYYVEAAKRVLAASPSGDVIYVRVGEEFNGSWFPWAAQGKEQDFVDTYRHFVDSFRSVSDRFRFEWNVNVGESMDPAKAYPGDAYVDVIGMDFYYYNKWDPQDPATAFDYMVHRTYGLQWLEDFAGAHGKPTAYSEWGIDSDADAYVTKAAEWFQNHNVLYQSYWDSNAGFQGKLSDGQYAAAAEAFRAAFADHSSVKSSVSYTLVGSEKNLILTGLDAVNGTGNALDNALTGNDAANRLDGKGGADTMKGGLGNDTYIVDHPSDVVLETANGGRDTVLTSISFSLAAGVEVERLATSQAGVSTAIDLAGNAFAQRIDGNQGANTLSGHDGNDVLYGYGENDVLSGGAGKDVLVGGLGNDVFLFDTAPNTSTNFDRIVDFDHGANSDVIALDPDVFSALTFNRDGTLAGTEFASIVSGQTYGKNVHVVYRADKGAVYYDADGYGGHVAVLLTVLNAFPLLTSADFVSGNHLIV